jgi:hypothetical protein
VRSNPSLFGLGLVKKISPKNLFQKLPFFGQGELAAFCKLPNGTTSQEEKNSNKTLEDELAT